MEIGGYFDLALNRGNNQLHAKALALNSGRNAFELILMHLGVKKLYIPYFTCDVVLEPVHKLGIPYEWYRINAQLELAQEFGQLAEGEYILYNNYFGVKGRYIRILVERFPDNLIIDNAQALFFPDIPAVPAFYSPRKFMGLPDGGYAYVHREVAASYERDLSHARCSHLLKRLELKGIAGYADFKENSQALSMQPVRSMSLLTRRLVDNVDLEEIKRRRNANFTFLHGHLQSYNALHLALDQEDVPMVYPFLIEDPRLRQKLIDHRIFVATYWPNVFDWCDAGQLEHYLARHILPLPIDQRYEISDMKYIISTLGLTQGQS